MYRICYTVIETVPGFAKAGDRREIIFSTNFAFTAYKEWTKAKKITNLTLEEYTNGSWSVILPAANEVSHA